MKHENKFVKIILFSLLILSLLSGCTGTPGSEPAVVIEQPALDTPTVQPGKALPTLPPANAPTTLPNADLASIGDPYIPELGNLGYDVQHYALQITLDPQTYWLEGNSTISLVTTMDGLTSLSFDFIGMDVSAVTVDGQAATYSRDAKKLYIDLPGDTANHQDMVIGIQYAGEPVLEPSPYVPFINNIGIQYANDMLYIVSEPDGARTWMPVNDHPRDKATYHLEISVPKAYVAVSNGALLDTVQGDQTNTYTWEINAPTASYLMTIAVGNYVPVESSTPNGVPLRSYVTPENQADFTAMQPKIGAMLDWMSTTFGPYPFDEFGYVEVSDIGASLETQTMVIMSAGMLMDESVLCHEMAHMWFGDSVSLDTWGDIWRNEGFATYVALMWSVQDDPQQLDDAIAGLNDTLEANPSDYPLNDPPAEAMFGLDSYYKGAVMIHDLRRQIGDEAFFNGVQEYLRLYRGRTASQADFQSVMEQAAGTSLDAFFTGWFE